MANHALAIPEPIPSDPETVVTALETAAVFGEKGDADEAMRWVRQAAAAAGENGADVRALDLARAASEITSPPSAPRSARTIPTPPPRPSSLRPPPPDTASRPPPPSVRVRTESPSAATAARASQPPRTLAPLPRSGAPRSVPSSASASSTSASRPSLRSPSVAQSSSAAQSHRGGAAAIPAARAAVRVSLSAGPEPGLFVARLLADGERPALGASEAFVVLSDPMSELFAARAR